MVSNQAYANWKAPNEDSAILIWPPPQQILQDTRENNRRLSSENSANIQGIPLRDLRHQQRQLLNLPDDQCVIVTGHQTELYHAGVWAKLAMIDAAAKSINARTLLLAVDTDAPKHLSLRWPRFSEPISEDPAITTAPWSGLLKGPTSEHLRKLEKSLSDVQRDWPFIPMAGDFLADLEKHSAENAPLSNAIVDSMKRLDQSLGLQHQSVIASPLWSSEPYLALAYHLLARADEFATKYNDALTEYRIAHKIRTPARPMPDLQVSGDRCESPFWVDFLTKQDRQRCGVFRTDNTWRLKINGDNFPLNPQLDGWNAAAALGEFLNAHHVRLSPRALTLTLFVRLFFADQFLHGIGGGRYDQVTDRVIEQFFGIAPPAFSVTTATLYFPTAVGQSRVCMPCLHHEGHRLEHAVLGKFKRDYIAKIQSLPRYSSERQVLFSQMHQQRKSFLQSHPSLRAWREKLAKADLQLRDEEVHFDRELFYAIQPRERLVGLIGKYQMEFGI